MRDATAASDTHSDAYRPLAPASNTPTRENTPYATDENTRVSEDRGRPDSDRRLFAFSNNTLSHEDTPNTTDEDTRMSEDRGRQRKRNVDLAPLSPPQGDRRASPNLRLQIDVPARSFSTSTPRRSSSQLRIQTNAPARSFSAHRTLAQSLFNQNRSPAYIGAAVQRLIQRDHRAARRRDESPSPTPSVNSLGRRFFPGEFAHAPRSGAATPVLASSAASSTASSPLGSPYLAPRIARGPQRGATRNPISHRPAPIPCAPAAFGPAAAPAVPLGLDLAAPALSDADQQLTRTFHDRMEELRRETCTRCKESWFDMKLNPDGICGRCRRVDTGKKEHEPFLFSAANNMDFGPVAELPELSMTEELLISRVHATISVCTVRGAQHRYSGHIAHFYRSVGKLYTSLPLLPAHLEIIMIKPAGAATSLQENAQAQFRGMWKVRRSVITRWLEYLRVNHPGYHDFVWNTDALQALPEDGDVDHMLTTIDGEGAPAHEIDGGPNQEGDIPGPTEPEITTVINTAENDNEIDRWIRDLIDNDAPPPLPLEVRPQENGAGASDARPDSAAAGRRPDTARPRGGGAGAESARPDDAHHVDLPSFQSTPINELAGAVRLFALSFPSLFPRGCADFYQQRPRKVEFQDWARHAIKWYDDRFARHPTFPYHCLNMMLRFKTLAKSRYFVSKDKERTGNFTKEDLARALDPDVPDAPGSGILQRIGRFAATIPGMRHFWWQKKNELQAFAYNLGVPAAFITLSPADLHWDSLFRLMPGYEAWRTLDDLSRVRRARTLLKGNPHIAAYHFWARNKIFRDTVLTGKFGITDYWVRFEWQGRGSPHTHGLYWFKDAPVPIIDDEESCRDFVAQWDRHVVAWNPEPERTGATAMAYDPMALRPIGPDDFTVRRLSDLVNRVQRHVCSPAYCQRKKKAPALPAAPTPDGPAVPPVPAARPPPQEKITVCRFGFPHDVCACAKLQRDNDRAYHAFVPRRNDPMMQRYAPALALSWLANTDISPCTGFQAVMNYAAKYCSKAEKGSKSTEDAAKNLTAFVSVANPVLSFACKYLNSLIVERDFSAQECAHVLLGHPYVEDSRTVMYVNCRPYSEHVGMLEMPEEGEITARGKSPYEKYLMREKRTAGRVTYFQWLTQWDFTRGDPANWRKKSARAKTPVLRYNPRYLGEPGTPSYEDFCRVKMILNHPHDDTDELVREFSTWEEAYAHCQQFCEAHEDDHYGEELPGPEEDRFEPPPPAEADDDDVEAWQRLHRLNPQRARAQDPYELLGVRDLDLQYDWSGHVGRYEDPAFGLDLRKYWSTFLGESVAPAPVFCDWAECERLNPEQRIAYDHIVGHADTPGAPQLLMHVDGGGGTGKSFLINVVCAHLRQILGGNRAAVEVLRTSEESLLTVAVTAPTGAAASNVGGRTIHSLLRLPTDRAYKKLEGTEKMRLLSNLKGLKYLIVDEKSMLGLTTFHWINLRMGEIFGNDRPFGGVNVILIGDFYQLPPVKQAALYTPMPTPNTPAFKSMGLAQMKGIEAYALFSDSVFLQVVQRQVGPEQEAFRTALQELRTAQSSTASFSLLSTRVASGLGLTELASFDGALRVYTTRAAVDEHNKRHLVQLNQPVIWIAADHTGAGAKKVDGTSAGNLVRELPLSVGVPRRNAHGLLTRTPGSRVMLTRNISPEVGLVNGACGNVYDIGWHAGAKTDRDPANQRAPLDAPHVVMVAFDKYTGPGYKYEDDDGTQVELVDSEGRKVVPILRVRHEFLLKGAPCTRTQFPLIVAYAITVHKSQGITVDRIVVKVGKEFAPGLNYVACSRVRTLEGLLVEEAFPHDQIQRPLNKCKSRACASSSYDY